MLGPPCLSPRKRSGRLGSMHALWHTTHHGNHRQPRLLVALSACDHGLIPVFRAWFSPLVQESWRVGYPACWFTPPRFRSRRSGSPNDRLSSGQHTVSCPPGRRTTLRIHNTSQRAFRRALMRRESSSIALSTIDKAMGRHHFKASHNLSIQSTFNQAIQWLQIRW